jgi:hypothetical protein
VHTKSTALEFTSSSALERYNECKMPLCCAASLTSTMARTICSMRIAERDGGQVAIYPRYNAVRGIPARAIRPLWESNVCCRQHVEVTNPLSESSFSSTRTVSGLWRGLVSNRCASVLVDPIIQEGQPCQMGAPRTSVAPSIQRNWISLRNDTGAEWRFLSPNSTRPLWEEK